MLSVSNGPAHSDSRTYTSDNLLNALLMTLHLQEGLDLANSQVFPVAKSDQLVKGAEQLVCVPENLTLV